MSFRFAFKADRRTISLWPFVGGSKDPIYRPTPRVTSDEAAETNNRKLKAKVTEKSSALLLRLPEGLPSARPDSTAQRRCEGRISWVEYSFI